MKTRLKNIFYSCLLLTILFLIWQDCRLLFRTSVPVGVDGYYYILQINSLHEFGHLYFLTDTPLILFFWAILTFFIGNTIIVIKSGAIILQIFLCLGAASLLQTVAKNIRLTALSVFLVEISILHLYFLSEFLSNLGALPKIDYQIVFDKSIVSSDGDFALVEDFEMRKDFATMPVEERCNLLSENSHLKFLTDESTR